MLVIVGILIISRLLIFVILVCKTIVGRRFIAFVPVGSARIVEVGVLAAVLVLVISIRIVVLVLHVSRIMIILTTFFFFHESNLGFKLTRVNYHLNCVINFKHFHVILEGRFVIFAVIIKLFDSNHGHLVVVYRDVLWRRCWLDHVYDLILLAVRFGTLGADWLGAHRLWFWLFLYWLWMFFRIVIQRGRPQPLNHRLRHGAHNLLAGCFQ